MPFALNSSKASTDVTREFNRIFFRLIGADESNMFVAFCASGVGCSDKDWNMICLNSQVHDWWAKAYFGLKCLGVSTTDTDGMSRLQIQFHWLQRHTGDPVTPVEMEVDAIREMLATVQTETDGYRSGSTRPLQTGQTFYINGLENDKARKMKLMLDIQWACVRVVAMSEAAFSPELLNKYCDDPDDNTTFDEWEDILD